MFNSVAEKLHARADRIDVDWIKVCHAAKFGGALVFAFASGGWFRSIGIQEGRMPYLERATARQEQLERVLGTNPVQTVNCLRKKAAEATVVANIAVSASNFAPVSESVLATIPDCPPAPPLAPSQQPPAVR